MRTLACLALAACAHRGADTRPSEAELRAFYYGDDEGLAVVTTHAQVTQRLPWGDTLVVEAGVDAIELEPVDAVSSASVSVDGEGGLVEQRYEIAPGYALALGDEHAPVDVSARARVSSEPDYLSWSGELGVVADAFERNTTLGAFIGYGHDTIAPTRVAEGDEGAWPAAHERVYGVVSLRQILGKRVDVSAGLALTWQSGALASPYRRAQVLVGRGFFARLVAEPERHPGERTRAVGSVASAIWLGSGVALHPRITGYADSWGVLALAPELGVNVELGARGLLLAAYRFTTQGAADFFARSYRLDDELRTGDRRLGALDEHQAGLELRWTVVGVPEQAGALDLALGWALSWLTYRGLEPDRPVTAHEGTLGLLLRY